MALLSVVEWIVLSKWGRSSRVKTSKSLEHFCPFIWQLQSAQFIQAILLLYRSVVENSYFQLPNQYVVCEQLSVYRSTTHSSKSNYRLNSKTYCVFFWSNTLWHKIYTVICICIASHIQKCLVAVLNFQSVLSQWS